MKKYNHILNLLALLLAVLLIISTCYNLLLSSNFPRGLYAPPNPQQSSVWDDFASLHPNIVWYYSGVSNTADSLDEFTYAISSHNMKSMMRAVKYWDSTHPPYGVENYSWGQYDQWFAIQDSVDAMTSCLQYGTGWYHFHQLIGAPGMGNTTWKVTVADDDSGTILTGPMDSKSWALPFMWGMPKYHYPDHGYIGGSSTQDFKFRIRVKTWFDSSIDTNTTVFRWKIYFYAPASGDAENWKPGDNYTESSDTTAWWAIKVKDFNASNLWQVFTWPVTLGSACIGSCSHIWWPDSLDLEIHWLDFMDSDRAAKIVIESSTRRDTLGRIIAECDSLENIYGADMAGWAQADEPIKSQWKPMYWVTDTLITAGLENTVAPMLDMGIAHQVKGFVTVAKPKILEMDYYPFTQTIASQAEFDTLTKKLDSAYVAAYLCTPVAEFRYLGQVHGWKHKTGSTWNWELRNPKGSEITAESFIALAHGAKGLNYWKYLSGSNSTDSSFGLVNFSFEHPTETIYDEKWQAVRDVYTQLDSIGNTLLDLERDAAYCCTNPNYQPPVTGISFSEGGDSYIEVGQFHDSTDANYLIIVNRRTDADRHITVVTSDTVLMAMRDLYTQERFLSTTGDFEAIPFAAGQGRVFKLERF